MPVLDTCNGVIYHKILSNRDEGRCECLCTGAQTTVVGLTQAKIFANCLESLSIHTEDRTSIDLEKIINHHLGSIAMRVPIFRNLVLTTTVDIVDVNVPLFIGLDLLENTSSTRYIKISERFMVIRSKPSSSIL